MGAQTDSKRRADAPAESGWVARPHLAKFVRFVLFILPILVGWFAVKLLSDRFWRPDGWTGLVVWLAQALIVAVAADALFRRVVDRLMPLTLLLNMTLIFPDDTPSRFGMALRAGTTRKLEAQALDLGTDEQQAAVNALELVSMLGNHDRLTRGHSERVRAYGELIAAEMELEPEELNRLRWGILLHDIGKLAVPPEILNKPGSATEEEWAVLRRHPENGARILAPLAGWLGEAARAAGDHHERFDGTGYPVGLAGDQISLAGRICAVADAYDVITSRRSYKAPLSAVDARKELVACAGTHFDPDVVKAFLRSTIGQPRASGVLGPVLELPANLAGLLPNATSTVITVGRTAGAAVVITTASAAGPSSVVPETLAFDVVDSVAIADALGTTTTVPTAAPIEVPTTTAPPSTEAEPETTTTIESTSTAPTTAAPTTPAPTTAAPTTTTSTTVTTTSQTAAPTTAAPTTAAPTTAAPTTTAPSTTTTAAPTTTTTTAPTTTTAAPPASPTGSGFVEVAAGGVPSSLDDDRWTAENNLRLFQEADGHVLSNSLLVTGFSQGNQFNGNTLQSTRIPAGTTICVWFVHGDTNSNADIDATIDFGGDVLGISLNQLGLQFTDGFALDGVDYQYNATGQPDRFVVTGSVIEIHFDDIDSGRDQVRVFVAC